MNFTINKRLLVIFILSFIVVTVVGTVFHEFGHWLAARAMGFHAHISYAKTSYNNISAMNPVQRTWVTLAGPLLTMITGTIGFLFLQRRKQEADLTTAKWGLVFVALFWLRQPALFILLIAEYFFTGKFSHKMDEIKLAGYFGLPAWSLITATALFGIVISGVVLFQIIPRSARVTFIISGLIGGVTGYLLWMMWLGPVLMP